MTLLISAILIGFLAGMLGGFLGIGGGSVIIPLMVFTMGISQHTAQGISMLAIIPTTLVSAWYFHKNKLINYRAAGFLAIGSVCGALISSNLVQYISAFYLTKIFGIFVIIMGIKIFWGTLKKNNEKKPNRNLK